MDYEEPTLSPLQVNFTLIAEDEVRKQHELPWLEQVLSQSTDDGLHDRPPGREYHLGFRDAIKLVMEQPEREVFEATRQAALAHEAERKKEADAGRIRSGSTFLRRLNPAWWNPKTR